MKKSFAFTQEGYLIFKLNLRRLLEQLAGPLVFKRSAPMGARHLVVSPAVGGLKYLLKPANSWDPELVRVAGLLVTPGACVWDIGANVGLFSVAAAFHAGAGGYVLAVEADVDAVRLLYRTAQIQPSDGCRIEVLPIAVARSAGFVQFAIAKRARAANSIDGYGTTQTGGVKELRTLPALAIDDLLERFPPPVVLKVDVEGAEFKVLSGATRLLSEIRPVIYCECSEQRKREVSDLLHGYGYRLYDGASYDAEDIEEIDQCSHNTVAIPASERHMVASPNSLFQ